MIWASLFLLSVSAQAEVIKSPATPFWKAKEKVHRRIQEERAIVVAVHTDSIKNGERLVINGGGQISTPISFAFQQAMQFENLKLVTEYVEEIRFGGDQLFVKVKAFGYEASMWMKIKAMPNSGIHFEVVKGTLKGLVGDLKFEKITGFKTEIGISAQYDYVEFPIATLFAEFGIEAILSRMAFRLRSLVEDRYERRGQ